jgi:hypothetical protein
MCFSFWEREGNEYICSEEETQPLSRVYIRYQVHKFEMEPKPQQLELATNCLC